MLAPHAPPGCALLTSPEAYATIVGSFERRSCDVQARRASPSPAGYLPYPFRPGEGRHCRIVPLLASPLD